MFYLKQCKMSFYVMFVLVASISLMLSCHSSHWRVTFLSTIECLSTTGYDIALTPGHGCEEVFFHNLLLMLILLGWINWEVLSVCEEVVLPHFYYKLLRNSSPFTAIGIVLRLKMVHCLILSHSLIWRNPLLSASRDLFCGLWSASDHDHLYGVTLIFIFAILTPVVSNKSVQSCHCSSSVYLCILLARHWCMEFLFLWWFIIIILCKFIQYTIYVYNICIGYL